MKISKLASLIKEYKIITVLNTEYEGEITRQHIVVGGAMYPLDGWPRMDKEALLTILDIPQEKRKEYNYTERAHTEYTMQFVADALPEVDSFAAEMSVRLKGRWGEMIPFNTENGVMFVDADYVKVIADVDGLEWYLRTLDGGNMMVAKYGFETVACMAVETSWMSEETEEDIRAAAGKVSTLWEKKRREEMQRNGQQQTI